MTLKEQFDEAIDRVNKMPQSPGQAVQLTLYGLFKQATNGDAGGDRPGMMDIKGRAKYDAWAERRGMSTDEAMTAYIELADSLDA